MFAPRAWSMCGGEISFGVGTINDVVGDVVVVRCASGFNPSLHQGFRPYCGYDLLPARAKFTQPSLLGHLFVKRADAAASQRSFEVCFALSAWIVLRIFIDVWKVRSVSVTKERHSLKVA